MCWLWPLMMKTVGAAALQPLSKAISVFAGGEGVSALALGYQDVSLFLVSASPSSSDQRLRIMLTRAAEPLIARGYRVAVVGWLPTPGVFLRLCTRLWQVKKMGRRMKDQSGPLFYSDLGLYRLLLGLRDQVRECAALR